MAFVATLICADQKPVFNDELVRELYSLSGSENFVWLSQNEACDIYCSQETTKDKFRDILRDSLSGLPIDWAVQETRHRRKKLLLADMDSTIIEQECIDELAAELGIKDKVAEITNRAMNGEIEFEPALRERVSLLKGLNSSIVSRILDTRIFLTPGARELIATMRTHGAYCALISGGFTVFAAEIARLVGFDEFRANSLVVENGKFSGQVAEPILGQNTKQKNLFIAH